MSALFISEEAALSNNKGKPSKSPSMNETAGSNNIFWQYNFKWSRTAEEHANSTFVNLLKKPIVAQEFWLFVAYCFSLLFFMIIWAFVLVACKLIIRMIQDQNTYDEDPENYSGPMERNSALMVNCATFIDR